MLKEYKRTTRECAFSDLTPEIVRAVRKYVEKHELENVESNVLICVETSSEKLQQGFFSKIFGAGSFAVKTAAIVTPNRLVWATLDNKNNTATLTARLSEIEVKNFRSDLVEDTGLEIFGAISRFPERVTAFIGLGEEEAAQKLRRILKEAVENARLK